MAILLSRRFIYAGDVPSARPHRFEVVSATRMDGLHGNRLGTVLNAHGLLFFSIIFLSIYSETFGTTTGLRV